MKKRRILLTDTLIKDFVYIYQKDYIVDKLLATRVLDCTLYQN